MKIEHKVVPVIQTKVIDEAQGIVGAYVSVTGVVDSVKDRIIPGAYQSTLAQRTPKGVWSHDWDTPISKTLVAEELLPGDDRLPKKTRNGDDWPTAAGALYVETQFNLGTQRGKDAFSDVVFFGDEQEWSIGYNVPPGTAKFDAKTGVRELSYVDLYEYSPVLFGAMDLTSTAGVKDAQEQFRQAAAAGTLAVDQVTVEERKDQPAENSGSPAADDAVFDRGATVVTGTTPLTNTTGETLAVAQGFTDAAQATITTPQDNQYIVQNTNSNDPVPAGSGTDAGVTLEPRPDVEVAADPDPATEAPKAAEFVVRLTPQAQEKIDAIQADVPRKLAEKDADPVQVLVETQEATKAILDDQANYAVAKAGTEESKAEVTLTGSYEERQQAIRKVLPQSLADLVDLEATDEYGYPTTFVTTEATFANRVVAVAYDMNDYSARYFEAAYTFGPDGVTLKTPREVRVEAAVVAKGAARAAQFAKALTAFHGEEGTKVGSFHFTVKTGGAAQGERLAEAVKAAISNGMITPEAPQTDDEVEPEAKGADGMVTLSEADLMMLDRLKLEI